MALAVETALRRRLEVRRMHTKQRVLGTIDDLPINFLQRPCSSSRKSGQRFSPQ